MSCLSKQDLKPIVEEFSIALVGPEASGKSSYIRYITEKTFLTDHEQTIEDTIFMKMKIGLETFSLTFFDTAGYEEFSHLRDDIIPKSMGFIFFISYQNEFVKSFSDIMKILTKVTLYYKNKRLPEPPMILVITMQDLNVTDRKLSHDQLSKIVKSINIPFFEVSCKTGDNVEESLLQMVAAIDKKQNPMKFMVNNGNSSGDIEGIPRHSKSLRGSLKALLINNNNNNNHNNRKSTSNITGKDVATSITSTEPPDFSSRFSGNLGNTKTDGQSLVSTITPTSQTTVRLSLRLKDLFSLSSSKNLQVKK